MADSGQKSLTKKQNADAGIQMVYGRISRLAALGQHWIQNLEENITPPKDFTTTTFNMDVANDLLLKQMLGI